MKQQAITTELRSIRGLAEMLIDRAARLEKSLGAEGTAPRPRKGLSEAEKLELKSKIWKKQAK